MPLTVVMLGILSDLLFRHQDTRAFLASLIALVCMMLVMLTTLMVNVPIDMQIKNWQPTTLPANWQDIRDRWHAYHVIRMCCSLLGFGAALAAALMMGRS
jgi:hypothetical protein